MDDALLEAVHELQALRSDGDDPAAEGSAAATTTRPRVESALPVREIQARLRQGRTVQEVARAAGVDPSWVERFAPPVFAEQAQIIRRVRSVPLRRARLGPSSHAIGDAIRRNLAARGVALSPEEFANAWSTRQLADGRWAVRFTFRHRSADHVLRFDLAETTGVVTPADRQSGQLGYVAPPISERAAAADPIRSDGPAVVARPTARRPTVTTGFRPDDASSRAVSRPARERARAAAAMSKAAAKRSVATERAAARRAKEKRIATVRRERAARVEEARKARQREAAEKAKAVAAARKAVAAKKVAAERSRKKAEKLVAAQARRAEAALVAAERAKKAERAVAARTSSRTAAREARALAAKRTAAKRAVAAKKAAAVASTPGTAKRTAAKRTAARKTAARKPTAPTKATGRKAVAKTAAKATALRPSGAPRATGGASVDTASARNVERPAPTTTPVPTIAWPAAAVDGGGPGETSAGPDATPIAPRGFVPVSPPDPEGGAVRVTTAAPTRAAAGVDAADPFDGAGDVPSAGARLENGVSVIDEPQFDDWYNDWLRRQPTSTSAGASAAPSPLDRPRRTRPLRAT